MNLRLLVRAFTLQELNELSNLIHECRSNIIKLNLSNYPPPDTDLIELSRTHKVKAILGYRERHPEFSLLEAKTIMDVYTIR